jgi:hypothetical protein
MEQVENATAPVPETTEIENESVPETPQTTETQENSEGQNQPTEQEMFQGYYPAPYYYPPGVYPPEAYDPRFQQTPDKKNANSGTLLNTHLSLSVSIS